MISQTTILFLGFCLVVNDAIAPMPLIAMPNLVQSLPSQTIVPSDLPASFEPAPAFLRKLILSGIRDLNPDLKREGIILDEATTFIDLEQAEMVMGLTANLPNQAVKKIDVQLRSSDAQQIFMEGLKKSLSNLGKVEITEVQELNSLKNIGQVAKGFAIEAKLINRGFTLFTESIAFRRGNKVILVILGGVNHPLTGIRAADIAFRMDQRLIRK